MASSARIDELRKKFDENPRRYFAPLANEYRKAGDLEQAIFICQEYLPQQPGHMSGHIVYGQALFELGRNDEARAVFETALSLDPENLIALRHLGDIARKNGDLNTARTWYQRVLEADPRNEEIAQIMMSLLTPAAPSPAVAPPAVALAAVDHSAPTPLSTATVPPPTPPAPSSAFEVEKSSDAELGGPPPIPKAEPPKPEPKKQEELLDLDEGFDLGGVPLSTLRASKPVKAADVNDAIEQSTDLSFDMPSTPSAEPRPVPAAPAAASETSQQASTDGLLDDALEAFEADPFAIAANPNVTQSSPSPPAAPEPAPEPPIDLAADVDIGLPDDGSASMTAAGDALDGLQTFEAGVIADADKVEPLALDTGSFFDMPPVGSESQAVAEPEPEPQPEPEPEPEPEPAAHSVAEPTAAFVTETMAELYLQQGHLESALDIYRQLVELRPNDAALQARRDAVEQQIYGTASHEEVEAPVELATPTAYGGPTIREFLAGLVSRAPTPAAQVEAVQSEPVSEAVAEPSPEPELMSEPMAEPSSEPTYQPASEMRPTPSSSQTVSESLDVFFGGGDAPEPDANAANTLAEAFAPEGPETAPLQGMPAHRASSELSLDHVFKGGGPAPSGEGSENFSFDQFFSPEAGEAAPADGERRTPPSAEATDDIAQFNAWLNGLKKT